MSEPTPNDAAGVARPAGEAQQAGLGVTVGNLAARQIVSVGPDASLREAAKTMHDKGIGSVLVLDADGRLEGILTERDLLRAAATEVDLDATPVQELMTTEVFTAEPHWQVYEAAAAMSERGFRHLVVAEGEEVHGVLSIRDVLLAGQRVELAAGNWAVLRDPLTFTVRERRRLQKALVELDGGALDELNVDRLIGELVGSWSFDLPLPADEDTLAQLDEQDYRLLRAAVLDEIPYLQRAVQPAPGWRQWNH